MVLLIDLHAVVFGLYMRLMQETDHFAPQLTTPLSRDDFDHSDLLFGRLIDNASQFGRNRIAVVENVMKIQNDSAHNLIIAMHGLRGYVTCKNTYKKCKRTL